LCFINGTSPGKQRTRSYEVEAVKKPRLRVGPNI
jgi:hypothetical protein